LYYINSITVLQIILIGRGNSISYISVIQINIVFFIEKFKFLLLWSIRGQPLKRKENKGIHGRHWKKKKIDKKKPQQKNNDRGIVKGK
jgi:hypothetical protein